MGESASCCREENISLSLLCGCRVSPSPIWKLFARFLHDERQGPLLCCRRLHLPLLYRLSAEAFLESSRFFMQKMPANLSLSLPEMASRRVEKKDIQVWNERHLTRDQKSGWRYPKWVHVWGRNATFECQERVGGPRYRSKEAL